MKQYPRKAIGSFLKSVLKVISVSILLAGSHLASYVYGQDYGAKTGYERGLYDGSMGTVMTYRYMCHQGSKVPDGRGGFYWCSRGASL